MFNWKDSISKWNSGIVMGIEELKHLSNNLKCCRSEKYWIDLEIIKKLNRS